MADLKIVKQGEEGIENVKAEEGEKPQRNPQTELIEMDPGLDYARRLHAKLDADALAAPVRPEISTVLKEFDMKHDISDSNAKYMRGVGRIEIGYSYANWARVYDDMRLGRARNLPVGEASGPCLIIGSGPTLDDHIDRLKEFPFPIFCSTSQAETLVAKGIDHILICGIDPRSNWSEICNVDTWEGRDAALITHPSIDPLLLANWPNSRVYFRVYSPGIPFYEHCMPFGYSFIQYAIKAYACAAAGELSIADLIGFNPIITCGVDFSTPGERGRFTPWSWKDGQWTKGTVGPLRYTTQPRLLYENGVPGDTMMQFYKMNFYQALRESMKDIYVLNDGSPNGTGACYELPQTKLDEIVGDGWRKLPRLSKRTKADILERYLIRFGAHCIELPDGEITIHHFSDKPKQAPVVVKRLNERLRVDGRPGEINYDECRLRWEFLLDDKKWAERTKTWPSVNKSSESQTGQPAEGVLPAG